MIKYKTVSFGRHRIEKVEVVKETEKTVWVKTGDGATINKTLKDSVYHHYFNSWQEAKDYLLAKKQTEIESIRRRLEYANSVLGNIKGLKEPVDEDKHARCGREE